MGAFIATFSTDEKDDEEHNDKSNDSTAQLSDVATAQQSSESEQQQPPQEQQQQQHEQQVNASESGGSETNEVDGDKAKRDGEYTNFLYWRNSLPSLDLKSSPPPPQSQSQSQSQQQQQQSSSSQDADSSLSMLSTNPTQSSSIIDANMSSPLKSQTSPSAAAAATTPKPFSVNQFESLISSKLKELTSPKIHTSSGSPSFMSSSSMPIFSPSHGQHQQQQQGYQHLNIEYLYHLSEELEQDKVPPILLSYFITMIEMNSQHSLDSDMNYNCAYNFPAIALTIGADNWRYIKTLYKRLAEDVSWKVRQTLAYSIHELAIILGTESTQCDLVPIFDSFIKDVDEVRIGIVANLTKFLRVLTMDYRSSYMPKLNDFLKMDNQRNWRFRNELGLYIYFPSSLHSSTN